jgi:hypothetical protein
MRKDVLISMALIATYVLADMLGPIIIDYAIYQHVIAWAKLMYEALGKL